MGALIFFTAVAILAVLLAHIVSASWRWASFAFGSEPVKKGKRLESWWVSISRGQVNLMGHAFNLAATIVFLFVSYRFIGVYGPDVVPMHYEHKPSLAFPFFHSEEARAAILGTLIALVVYVWYWDRRAAERRAEEVLKSLKDVPIDDNGRQVVSIEQVAAKLRAGLDRMDPASLALFLVLTVSIVVVEAPGAMKVLEAKVGSDGSVSLSLRPSTVDERSTIVPSYASLASGTVGGSVRGSAVLTVLKDRIEKDVISICPFFFWYANSPHWQPRAKLAETIYDSVAGLPTQIECASILAPESERQSFLPKQHRPHAEKLWDNLSKFRDYKALSADRTEAMVKCISSLADQPDAGIELRSVTRPLLESYARLSAALWVDLDRGDSRWPSAADPAMRGYLRAIAGLSDPSNPAAMTRLPDSAQTENCKRMSKFSLEVRDALKFVESRAEYKDINVCEAVTTAEKYRAIDAVCRMVRLDKRLPYGRMALAAFTYLTGDATEAVLQMERWIEHHVNEMSARSAGRSEVGAGGVADLWLAFIAVNFRNLLLRSDEGMPNDWRRVALFDLHPNASAGSLVRRFAPEFERLASQYPDICGFDQVGRMALMLAIDYDTHHIVLNRLLRQNDLTALFSERRMQGAYARVKPRIEPALSDCLRRTRLYAADGAEFARFGFRMTQIDYRLAYADYLESSEGRMDRVVLDSNMPKELRKSALNEIVELLAYVKSIRSRCGEARSRSGGRSSVCDYTYATSGSTFQDSHRLLQDHDIVASSEAILRDRLQRALPR
jgi:hypothetical protein